MSKRLPPAIRRLCLVVDIESYSALDHQAQLRAQAGLAWVLTAAVRRAGVQPGFPPRAVIRQNRGDGQLVLLPPGIDEARAIAGLVYGLADGMLAINAQAPRLRLRAALAQGVVQAAATGYVGKAIVDACRLVDSAALREALAAAPERDLAVAFTDDLYHDVVVHGFGGLVGSDFRQVHVVDERKGFAVAAWVSRPDPAGASPPDRTAGRWRVPVRRDRLSATAVLVAVVLAAVIVAGAWALRHETLREGMTVATSPTIESKVWASPPVEIVFFDSGQELDRCVDLSGAGAVPEGFELRLYIQVGKVYHLTPLPAVLNYEADTWTFPRVALMPAPRAGVPVTLFVALVPEAESHRLTENVNEQYAFAELPPSVVNRHTFLRSADNSPC